MKTIKVCLRMTTHPMYRDLINYPPRGVVYEIPKTTSTFKDFSLVRRIKKWLWIRYTQYTPPSVSIDVGDYDLIYSMGGTMVLNKFPWITDAEHVAAFCNFHTDKLKSSTYVKSILNLLTSKYCKKIMCWSFAAKKTIEQLFKNEEINKKLEVVYPTVYPRPFKKSKHDDIRLLFIGRVFFEKGGLQLLKAFEILQKRYDVELTIISHVPEEIKNKYKNVNYVSPNLSIDELTRDYYSKSDILILPTFIDTYGGVFLEAMNCGLSVITTKIYAIPEIVEDGITGFLIKPPISMFKEDFSLIYGPKTRAWGKFINLVKNINGNFIDEIVEKVSKLIEDDKLRKHMGKLAIAQIKKGKFSIKKRNRKLIRIYEESILC